MQCQLNEPIQIIFISKIQFQIHIKLINLKQSTSYSSMSKQKQLRRIVLDKLYLKKKNQPFYHNLKKSTRSNAPTQSTPNQPKNKSKEIQAFFQNFDSQCAIIYQPVFINNKKPLKRALQNQIILIDEYCRFKTLNSEYQQGSNPKKQSKYKNTSINLKQKSKGRLNTDYCERISSTNSSFFDLSKNCQDNCSSLFKNKSGMIKKISMQGSLISSKNQDNKPLVASSSNISKYTSPSHKIKSMSRIFSKRMITNQNQCTKIASCYQESVKKQKKIDQLRNAPKKQIVIPLNQQKIKRVQSLKQFSNGFKKTK